MARAEKASFLIQDSGRLARHVIGPPSKKLRRIEGVNLERAYSVYRGLHGILSPKEVRALRDSYGVSLREFSRFLGFGEQTVYRYEHGDIPDQAHNTVLLSAKSVDGAQRLLSQNGHNLSERSASLIKHRIQDMIDGVDRKPGSTHTLEDVEADIPSATNGYRRLSLERVAALVHELATTCHELYWTKLQKAMFFADMLSYERFSCSLTGLSYAHAPHGPVMNRKDEIRYTLVDRGTIGFREIGWEEVVVPLEHTACPFNVEELALIDEVAHFVNSFSTANELSDFSHKLSCWHETVDGQIIEYTRDRGEVGRALQERAAGYGR